MSIFPTRQVLVLGFFLLLSFGSYYYIPSLSHILNFSSFQGGVLDIPSNLTQIMDMKWLDTKYESLEKATELPELMDENPPMRNDRRGYGNTAGSSGRGGWGRDRNSRGGFSRGGGGGMRRPDNGWRNGNRFDSNHGPSPNKRFRFD